MSPSANSCRRAGMRKTQPGFTLLELVLVLAVMATIAAIAWPHLQPSLSRAACRAAALQLKADFAEAREQAIHAGEIREIRWKPGSNRYLIVAAGFDPRNDSASASMASETFRSAPAASRNMDEGSRRDPGYEFRELPGDVCFRHAPADEESSFKARPALGETDRTAPATTAASELDTAENIEDVLNSDNSDWILGVRFFPDGRATETTIELEGIESAQTIAIHLRGLTGGVKIGAVEAAEATEDFVGSRKDAALDTERRR